MLCRSVAGAEQEQASLQVLDLEADDLEPWDHIKHPNQNNKKATIFRFISAVWSEIFYCNP